MSIQIIILAAGQGKRMQSSLPKVLQQIGGKPLLAHVLETSYALNPSSSPIVVYGYQGNAVKNSFKNKKIMWVEQTSQLGTGHAVLQTLPYLNAERALILYGDVPLISTQTLHLLIEQTPVDAIGIITAILQQPYGYGRIKRDKNNQVLAVIEEKDATSSERHINEINTGIYIMPISYMNKRLKSCHNYNAQNEYYLTDLIQCAVQDQIPIHTIHATSMEEISGANDLVQLAQLERYYQYQQAIRWMKAGVVIQDPARFDVRGEVSIGKNTRIDINVILKGNVSIGEHCSIGANCIITDSVIGNFVHINENSSIDGAEIGHNCIIGPFARLRPETILCDRVHIGNFVEIKKSEVKQASKINHLSYIGDSKVGKDVNIGAGTITCNYDGYQKHKTIIGDNAFIGSNSQLVAPVTIGEGATIGAGSTITRDAPAFQLTLSRSHQETITGWERPHLKDKMEK